MVTAGQEKGFQTQCLSCPVDSSTKMEDDITPSLRLLSLLRGPPQQRTLALQDALQDAF